MLYGRGGIAVTFFVFDVLAVEGLPVTATPYSERRALLEALDVEGPRVRLVATSEDGEALFAAVCERGLEGIVAKRDRGPYQRVRLVAGVPEDPRDWPKLSDDEFGGDCARERLAAILPFRERSGRL